MYPFNRYVTLASVYGISMHFDKKIEVLNDAQVHIKVHVSPL